MKIKVFFVSILAILMTVSLYAETPMKIGFINVKKALFESSEGKRSLSVLQAQKEQIEKGLALKKAELDNKAKELQEGIMLSEAVKKQKKDELEILKKQFMQEVNKQKRILKADEERHTKRIIEDVVAMARKIGEAQGYDLIVEATIVQGLLYSKYKVEDITNKVILEYDKLHNIQPAQ